MKVRQPTRWLNSAVTAIDIRVNKSIGTTQVGRLAIDSKVVLGLKRAPPMRPMELTDSEDSGVGVAALAICMSPLIQVIPMSRAVPNYGCRSGKLHSEANFCNRALFSSVAFLESGPALIGA
jgi:hypothetical protein